MALERPKRQVQPLVVAVGVVIAAAIVGLVVLWPPASPDLPEAEELMPATVIDVQPLGSDEDVGLGARAVVVSLEVTGGEQAGREATVETVLEGGREIHPGDGVMVVALGETRELYITELQRGPALWTLALLFAGVVLLIGRWQGLRSLVGLALSLLLITRFIVPGILAGQPPALVALVGAAAIMIVTLYLAHGVNTRTSTAVVGTTVALVVTIGLAVVFIDWASITGFSTDDARFAQVVVADLDIAGLVLGGLIIAALGVLDDVTVAQTATVWALHDTDPKLTSTALFRTAMSVGRDHIASTVNTLFLAYAGASLTLLVLFSTSGRRAADIINSEIVATEVVKTMVGSLGLISAVPITTWLAATLVVRRSPSQVEASRRQHRAHDH